MEVSFLIRVTTDLFCPVLQGKHAGRRESAHCVETNVGVEALWPVGSHGRAVVPRNCDLKLIPLAVARAALLLAGHAHGPAPDEAHDMERLASLAVWQSDQAVLVVSLGLFHGAGHAH